MTIRTIEENFDSEVLNKVATHPLQSWEWGEARQKMGIEILRLGEFNGDQSIAVFTITFHKIPHTPFTIGYLPRSVLPSKEMLEKIFIEGKKRRAIFVKMEPNIKKNSKFEIRNSKLLNSPHPLFTDWTQVVDLTKSEEELLAVMKSKTRYNIKVAQKHNVTVREMTNDEGFEIFANLYFKTTARQKYHGHNKVYHKTVFDSLKDGISHILIAQLEVNGKIIPLSAFELFIFNDVAYYPYGGSSIEYRNVMAPNLLMWQSMLLAKSLGCRAFDMWGSLPPDYAETNLKDSDWAGFTRFKEGFGGEFVEFVGSYDLVINPVFYPIYNIAYRIRKRLI